MRGIPDNSILINKFPFLNADSNKSEWVYGNCDSDCWFDMVPPGWRVLAYEMLLEMKPYLSGVCLEVHQIKEKFGTLRFYYGVYIAHKRKKRLMRKFIRNIHKINKIVRKYEHISSKTCIVCGKPAVYMTTSWICPYCENCVPKRPSKIKITYGTRR